VSFSRSRSRRSASYVVALALAIAACGVLPQSAANADQQTASQEPLRTGWDPNEAGLSPSAVTGSNFGQLFATTVNGQVYAQPLVVGDTVLVSTENDWVYGLDAATGAIRWSHDVGPAWPVSTTGCADLTPNLGNTSTGVYDPATNTYYLSTKVDDGPDAEHPTWYLHALDATSGAERPNWPTPIIGTPANDPAHPFQAENVNQRPGLLLLNGAVYLAFGGQCDLGGYVGWVAGVNTTTRTVNLWSDEAGASSRQAGIWQSGGGLMSDGAGRIFLSTSNGVTPADSPGSTPPRQLSESVVRLGTDAGGAISAQDFFSPTNAAALDQNDQDLGSGAPVGLPSAYFGTAAVPHLLVQIGKDGRLFLLDRDHLGGKGQGAGGTDDVVQSAGPYQGVWGYPAAYGGQGGYLYVTQNQGSLMAFRAGTTGSGAPALSLAGNSTENFGYTSGSPIVTSTGTTEGTAVVWVVKVNGPSGANAQLCAYDAIPSGSHLALLRCFAIGTAVKFGTPASSGGRIYLGTRDGKVYGFGQPTTSALTTAQTSFGSVPVTQTGTATVTATAVRTVTVTGVSTSAPFAATAPTLPVTLTAGQSISVPVSFRPATPGSVTGTLAFSVVDAGVAQTIGAGLQGTGVQPGFTGSPAELDFGEIPVGSAKSLTVSFVNSGTADERVSAVSAPSTPFAVTGLPAAGTVLAPGQAVSASVRYTPTAAVISNAAVTVTGPDGSGTVTLTGEGVVGEATLAISPSSLDFGSIPVGSSATRTLTVENTGNLNVTVTKAAPPALPFVVNTPLPEGLVLTPGESVQVQVTFAPTAPGTFRDPYVISSDDGNGAHDIPVAGTATSPEVGTALPGVAAGGWVYNGSAAIAGGALVLTPATAQQHGSAVYSNPVPGDGLHASFTAMIGGGTGADGLTFAMLDAASSTGKSLGSAGGGLGFAGLSGVAVTLTTFQGTTGPSNNFIGLSTGGTGGTLTYAATTTAIPDLRTGTHEVTVAAAHGTVTVGLDGRQVLSAAMPVPTSVLPAFTAGTGSTTDIHQVSEVSITSGTTALAAPGTGWRFNGTAVADGSQAVLTPAQTNKAGAALYEAPVRTNGLTASFTLMSSGGTNGDGTTFALLDPAATSAASIGASGSALGVAGLPGVLVAFVTHAQNGIGVPNFAAVMTGSDVGPLTVVASTTQIPDLRAAPRRIGITITGTTIAVSVDGSTALTATVPSLTPSAIIGFTAGTGLTTDVHAVSDSHIVTSQ